MQPTKPWLPKPLLTSERARKVLGVLAAGEPDAETYRSLHRQKVIDLIRKAPDLYPIENWLNQPLNYLGDLKDPESVYLNLAEISDEFNSLPFKMIMFLKGKLPMQDLSESLRLEEDGKTPPTEFRQELEELILDEYLELAT